MFGRSRFSNGTCHGRHCLTLPHFCLTLPRRRHLRHIIRDRTRPCPSPRRSPNSPIPACLTAAVHIARPGAHLAAVPAGSRAASSLLLRAVRCPSRTLAASRLLALTSCTECAPWGLPVSWISGRRALCTMSGGQEDGIEGSDHIMDLGEGNTSTRVKRAKATNWPRVMSKFLLDWYLEKKKGMPPKSKFKKMHHVWCTSAVNAKFKTTFSVEQVHRHFRRFKEIWIIVIRYVNENGSKFDKKHKMLVLPPATMARLPIAERAILAKPIPFFDHLLHLFNDGHLDGVCMRNPVIFYDSDEEEEAQDALNIMATCSDTRDKEGADLDKVVLEGEDNHHEVAASSGGVPCEVMSGTSAPSAQPSGSCAESTMAALKPSTKKLNIVSKTKPNPKPQAPVQHDGIGRNMDVLNSTLVGIRDSATKPARAAPTSDPNAPLWNMLKEIPLTPADRLSVGMHLCKPEVEVHRSFFMSMGKEYLEAWARKFLSGEEPGAL